MANDNPNSPLKHVRRQGNVLVVEIAGDVDFHHSTAFQKSLMALLDESPGRIVLDLAGVGYMDSSGLAGLIKLLSHVRRGRIDLWLCRPTAPVRSLLELTRLDTVFRIVDTLEEALG